MFELGQSVSKVHIMTNTMSAVGALHPEAIQRGINRLLLTAVGSLHRNNFLSGDNDSRGKFNSSKEGLDSMPFICKSVI